MLCFSVLSGYSCVFFVVKKQGSLVQYIARICCGLEDGRRGHHREQKAIVAVKRKQRS
jgi:hypothetical protein